MKRRFFLIAVLVLIGLNLLLIPIDLIFGFDIASIVSLLISLLILIIINYVGISLNKTKYQLNDQSLNQKEITKINDTIKTKMKIKKDLWLMFLISVIITIIYVIIVNI